jgi:NADP-dependent 3-hydroxy acid dehydrogenase YdfG
MNSTYMAHKVLITGGSSGIGEALAVRLAREGSAIYLTGRSEERLEFVRKKAEDLGAKCFSQAGEVSNSAIAKSIVADANSKMGGINVLIANAGVGAFKIWEEMTDKDFDSQFNTNVRGVFVYIREVLPIMKEKNLGQIIVTSSNLGFQVTARGSIYCGTKYAVQGMLGSLREELKGTRVKTATINPGSVDTPWFSDYSDQAKKHRLDVEEVVDAMMLIINQGERSNIEHLLLKPTYQPI